MTTYFDQNGNMYRATSARAAANEAFGVSNHDDTSMWSKDDEYGWVRHVLGSGSADIQVSKNDLPFDLDDDAPYHLEVYSDEWGGGLVNGWTPAMAGSLNQVCPTISDDEASTYPTLDEAMSAIDMLREQHPERIRILNCHGVEVHEEIVGDEDEE